MSHDFDDKERMPERRSRRNPKVQKAETEKELKVLNDGDIHPVPGISSGTSSKASAKTTSAGSRGSDKRRAGRSSGTSEASGLTMRQERQIARKKKIRRFIVMAIAECFVLTAIFGYAYVKKQFNKMQKPIFVEKDVQNNDLAVETVEKMKGYWTIAIFGVDARDNAIDKNTNADVNIICNINQDTGEIRLVSVFRDSYLNISENGSYNKINQAYFLGGPQQAVSALNRNLDLNITDYMTFNWKAVAEGINVLGGVDIELSDAEFYYINSFITETVKATGIGSHQLTHAGMNHLDGVQAVAYGRLRLMDTDYARTERQRKIIALAFEKAKQADFNTLRVLIGTVFPHVATNIGVDDLVRNASVISKYHLSETTGFPQARGDARMGKKGAVVVPQTLESNVVKLHEFLFGDEDYTPSDTVKKISAKIAADSGMYKEGTYVDHVSTEGGVIQTPKTTAAAKTTAASDEDETKKESSTAKETDEDGKPIKKETETDEDGKPVKKETETDEDGKPVKKETDADGNPIEEETDEDGNPAESTSSRRPTASTAQETDEDGNPVERETSSHTLAPDESTSNLRPSGTGTNTGISRPGETHAATSASEEGTSATKGSVTTAPGTSTTPGTTAAVTDRAPGLSTQPTDAGTTPGTSTGPGAGTTSGTSTAPGTSITPNTGVTPGTSATTGTSAAPGSSSVSGVSAAPGSQTDTGTSQSGPVSGPGQ